MEHSSGQTGTGLFLDQLREFVDFQKEQGRFFFLKFKTEKEPKTESAGVLAGSCGSLMELYQSITQCKKCRLFQKRRQVVPGKGPPRCGLMLIGEGPGMEEDEQGYPFVGPAGELLTRMLQAIELKREEVYITNVVKCRPPQNRVPREDEIEACRGFLEEEIRLVNPGLLVTLGNCSTQTILHSRGRISDMRENLHHALGRRLIATFHPAYLLRNPGAKREAWEDLKKVRQEYDRL